MRDGREGWAYHTAKLSSHVAWSRQGIQELTLGLSLVTESATQGGCDPTSSVSMASSTILLGVAITGPMVIASGPLTTSFETRADHSFPGEDKAR